jgi:uncharacterized lipoprotein YmbA
LIVIQILLNRMVVQPGQKKTNNNGNNYWAANLQNIINQKMLKKIKTKGEAIQLLKVHMQNAENIIRNIIKVQQSNGAKKKIFTMMTEWLNGIATVTNEKIRETLYNIE